MRSVIAILCFAFLFPLAAALAATDTLDIYVLDVEGGKSVIIVTPAGQSVLIDAGMPPFRGGENTSLIRVLKQAKELNINEFDVIETTHYDVDHAGNIPALSAQIPGKLYVDHGPLVNNPKMASINRKAGEGYLAFIVGKKRMSVEPGDVIPLKGVKVTVLTSNEAVLTKPLKGAGERNPACPATPREAVESDDNSGSIGTLWQYGKFRMADFGDLLKWNENRAVCPVDTIGEVDLFLVSGHGMDVSNTPELLAALQPKVSIMNNGERKGGAPEAFKTLRGAPRFVDVWQCHYSRPGGDENSKEDFIANLSQQACQGFPIKVSAHEDGSFVVTNMRNNFSKTYKTWIERGAGALAPRVSKEPENAAAR